MSDCVFVEIRISKDDYNRIKEHEFGACEISESKGNVKLCAQDVNYAEWEELEDSLVKMKIPYDKEWTEGCEFKSGYSRHRVIDGKYVYYACYDYQDHIVDILDDILKSEGDLRVAVEQAKKKLIPFKCEPIHCKHNAPEYAYTFSELSPDARRIAIDFRQYRGGIRVLSEQEAREVCEAETETKYSIGGCVPETR